uniref:Uncharacterized protein n=1 Tax=Panagrolaimus sp. PS1159 TaxID=55785 RepID=A0AC35FG24_9BILA
MVLFQSIILNLIPSIFISWLICLCFKRPKPAAAPVTTVGQPSSGAVTDSLNQPTAPTTTPNPNAPKKVEFISDNDPKGDSLYNIKTECAFPKKTVDNNNNI